MSATTELLQEGRYRLNHHVPMDGVSGLFEGYDTVNDAEVLVKEVAVRPGRVMTMSQQEALKANFANEARQLTQVKHDSLLQVRDFFSEIGRQYLVMESVAGDDLAVLLERNKSAFALTDVAAWTDQLLDALNYLHTSQPPIIHRNIKPQNIKLASNGRIKLLAFGFSDEQHQEASPRQPDQSNGSHVAYAPLEQIWESLDTSSQKVISNSYDDRSEKILKEPADARSDIYSLGATLYHLVTGQTPVDPLERSIELLDGNADPLKAPHKIDPKIPVEFSEVLMRALEIQRENRFDSAVIMRQVVRTAMVRVREREEEEAREQLEAAEDIRIAEERRKAGVRKIAEEKQLKAELTQKRIDDEKAEKLRIAEEQRFEDERLAAEAEMLIVAQREQREKVEAEKSRAEEEQKVAAAQGEAARAVELERAEAEKLEVDRRAERQAETRRLEAAACAETERIESERLAAAVQAEADRIESDRLEAAAQAEIEAREQQVKQTAARAEEESLLDISVVPIASEAIVADDLDILNADVIEPVLDGAVEEEVVQAEVVAYEATAVQAVGQGDEIELGGLFAENASESKKGVNIPVFAGIAALVLLLAVVGFYFMSSGTTPTTPAASAPAAGTQPEAAQQEQSASVEAAAAALPSDSATVETPAASTANLTTPSQTGTRAAAQPVGSKVKKAAAEAPKAVEKKKAVTVDDLINDN